MSCGLYAVNSFRRFDGRLGTLRRSTSTAVRAQVGSPTMCSGRNNLRACLELVSSHAVERGRMRPLVCNRKARPDGARRLAVFALLAACRDTSSKQSEQKVNTADWLVLQAEFR